MFVDEMYYMIFARFIVDVLVTNVTLRSHVAG